MTATEFPFDEIRRLVAEGRSGAGGTLALRSLNTMLVNGQFTEVDKVLAAVPLDDGTPTIAVLYLTITSHGKQRLSGRAAFVDRVRLWMIEKCGLERTTEILQNLD